MSLEMADYEKSVERLQKDLKMANEDKNRLNGDLEDFKKRLDASEMGRNRLSESVAKLKAAAKKLKAELDGKLNRISESHSSNIDRCDHLITFMLPCSI